MHNQHAGLTGVLAEQRMTERHQQATHEQLLRSARLPRRRASRPRVAGGSWCCGRWACRWHPQRSGSAQAAGPFPSPLAAAILAGMAGGFTPEAFIGRAAELGRLKGALDRAEHGRPQVVLLAGDAGVGKTRLLAEFADQAQQRGARVLAGGCVELGDIGLAYLPVVDALRGLADDPSRRGPGGRGRRDRARPGPAPAGGGSVWPDRRTRR